MAATERAEAAAITTFFAAPEGVRRPGSCWDGGRLVSGDAPGPSARLCGGGGAPNGGGMGGRAAFAGITGVNIEPGAEGSLRSWAGEVACSPEDVSERGRRSGMVC